MSESLYGTQPGDFSEAEPDHNLTTDQFLAMNAEPLVPSRLIAERDAALAKADEQGRIAFDLIHRLDRERARADAAEIEVANRFTTSEVKALSAAEPLVPNLHARLTAERDAALARAEAAENSQKFLLDVVPMTQYVELRSEVDELKAKYALALEHLIAADDTQPQTDVDKVIDQLDRRIIGAPERTKLRGALDRAEQPQKGRAGADEGLGRAVKRWPAL